MGTGALLGLGDRRRNWGLNLRTGEQNRRRAQGPPAPETENMVPYYREHDIEMSFDVDIDMDDIANINRIRHTINKAFNWRQESMKKPFSLRVADPLNIVRDNEKELVKIQEDLKRFFCDRLLRRNRARVYPETFKHAYYWKELPMRSHPNGE